MTSVFASADSQGAVRADSIVPNPAGETSREVEQPIVSAVRQSRIKYAASLIYWTVRHRSLSRGRWVAAYEHGSMK
jgi:hypothetical protein